MRLKTPMFTLALLTVVIAAGQPARAQGVIPPIYTPFVCPASVPGLINWVRASPDTRAIRFTVTAMVEDDLEATNHNLTSYAEGLLRLDKAGRLAGSGRQYFNDRRHGDNHPFSPYEIDQLGITLDASSPGGGVMTLLSWGGGSIPFQFVLPDCFSDVQYGIIPTSPRVRLVIGLRHTQWPG
jgi:hypothetical protein